MIQIQNDAAALDFDFACNLLLSHFEEKRKVFDGWIYRQGLRQILSEYHGGERETPPDFGDDQEDCDDEIGNDEIVRVGADGAKKFKKIISEEALMNNPDVL